MATAAAEAAADLPEDVLAEILSRLPVKILLRFKSVCKRWCALIQNPNFITLHSHNCVPEFNDWILVKRSFKYHFELTLSLVDGENRIVDNLDVSFTGLPDSEFDVLGSCNGVVCLTCFFGCIIFLFNPAMREFRQIPPPQLYKPNRRNHLGFAFDPKANDYKVVRIATGYAKRFNPDNPWDSYDYDDVVPYESLAAEKVQIYDLSSNSWREIDTVVPKYYYWWRGHPFRCTSLDGVVYWLPADDGREIVAFYTFDESIEQIPLPDAFPVYSVTNVCILKDSLALVVSDDNFAQESQVDIWIRDGYGVKGTWTKKYTTGPVTGFHNGWGVRRNGELLLSSDTQMKLFNVNTQDVKEYHLVDNKPGTESSVEGIQVLPYTESLISVKRHVD